MKTQTNDIKQLRAAAISFLTGKINVTIGEIKRALGREPLAYDSALDKALKTVKIKRIKALQQVSVIDGKPIYLSHPITLYSGPSV